MGFFSDIGNAVSSAVSSVGDAAEGAVDAVVDTIEDAVDTVVDPIQDGIEAGTEWVCKNVGTIGCGVANILGGAIDGILEGGQSILDDVFDIVRDVAGIFGSVLRLDLVGILKGLGSLISNAFSLATKIFRFFTGGYVLGGIVKHFKRSALMQFVEELIEGRFENDPNSLAVVRKNIGLDDGRFGFRLPAQHRIFVMDSDNVELWRMHKDGVIDLYAMAGLLSFDSFPLLSIDHPNTVVKMVGADGTDRAMPINRSVLSRHISTEGQLWRIRVYAMSHQTVAQMLDIASRKLEEIGVILEWNDGENFAWFGDYTRQDITEDEYNFNSSQIESLLAREDYHRPAGVNCELLALGAFKLDNFGRVAGRAIKECEDFPNDCETPERSDQCCVTVRRRQSSGVIYRDVYPSDWFQYILPHEIGHYLGLCHCGHDGFQNVMFTSKSNSFVSLGLFSLYWDDEPHFSLEDGKNAWRFIVGQLTSCLTGEPESPIDIEMVARPRVSSVDSCAV